MSTPQIVYETERTWTGWESALAATRGNVRWKTLFSADLTDTDTLTAGIAVIRAGEELKPHRHTQAELYFVLEGEGIVTLGERQHTVSAGAAIFIPGDVRHGIANRSTRELRFIYVFAVDSFDQVVYRFESE